MPETRSRTDRIQFISEANGPQILDAYLEACEKGGKPLGELISLLVDDNGKIRDGVVEFRENPEVQGDLQTRPYDPDQGPDDNWTTVVGFQWVTAEADRARDWAQKMDGRVETSPDPEDGYSSKYWAVRLAADYDTLGFYYLGASATAPQSMKDGTVLRVGAMYYNTVFKRPYFWSGTSWSTTNTPAAAVTMTLDYIAGGGQNQFLLSTPDVHGESYTLSAVEPYEGVLVSKNGSRLVENHNGGADQYTVNYANNKVVLNASCTAGDVVQIDLLVPEERFTLGIKRIHRLVDFTPDGVTTTWNLERVDIVGPIVPSSTEEVAVYLDNVLQVPGEDYIVSGSQVLFTVAPTSDSEVWGLWFQPGGDVAGEYSLDKDPSPSLIADLSTDGNAILIKDATPAEVAQISNSGATQAYFGLSGGGVYAENKGSVVLDRGAIRLTSTNAKAPSLAAATGEYWPVMVDDQGNLFSSAPATITPDWALSDTSAGTVDLGTGATTQAWVEITDLVVTTTASEPADANDILTVKARVHVENKTSDVSGELDIGYGYASADPAAGAFKQFHIPAGFVGDLVLGIQETLVGTIATGTTVSVFGRVQSGAGATFGVNAVGSATAHALKVENEAIA
jgi:hypothetical protein